jgi:DNA-binding response OmpR family regulator
MREVVRSGYEQAAAYWRERAETAEAELLYLRETTKGNAQVIAHAMRMPMQPASCLEILMRKAPEAVSKQHLTANITHSLGFEDRAKLTDVVICKLRKFLRAKGFPDAIKTVWGFGYALDGDVAIALANEVLTRQEIGKGLVTICSPSPVKIPSTDKKRVLA